MRNDFFVVSTPVADGERFMILRREGIPPINPFLWSSSIEGWRRAFEYELQTAPQYSEEGIRERLGEMGLSTDAIEDQIRRARNMHTFNEKTTWECTTRIGYRNDHGQEVIRNTRLAGTLAGQRVFELHCSRCGHEYGANGSEVYVRRCPCCQGGSPGLSVPKIE